MAGRALTRGPTVTSPEPGSSTHDTSEGLAVCPRLIVVSYLAHVPLTPRGARTRALLDGLRREWTVELIAGPAGSAGETEAYRVGQSLTRRVLSLAHSSTLLDRVEPWSWRCFRNWNPVADGALLIGYPFSPLAYAARILCARGIPYVVDVGDPWVLTAHKPLLRGPARIRARAAETRLWAGSSGAIVTTTGQAELLRSRFPTVPVLVRPNGLRLTEGAAEGAEPRRSRRSSASVLTIAHYGQLTSLRVSITAFLETVAASGRWRRIELHQFGSDWTGELARQSAAWVIFHQPRPWSEIVATAAQYDLALVVGNRNPIQLPSKAVAYLQLPIPRLAVVQKLTSDSLADYVADKPGWLTLAADAPDVAARIDDYVSRRWSRAELRPPERESWDRVAETVRRFLSYQLSHGHASKPGR